MAGLHGCLGAVLVVMVAGCGWWKLDLQTSEPGEEIAEQFPGTDHPEPLQTEQPPANEEKTNGLGMMLREIPAGTFRMGSNLPVAIGPWETAEFPAHEVTLTKRFFMGKYEVTVGQFRKFVEATGYQTEAETSGKGVNTLELTTGKVVQLPEVIWSSPGFEQSELHPVVGVSWEDARRFCEWLSETEGQNYRLPTEAEWEYACRAGTNMLFSSGGELWFLNGYGNCGDHSLKAVFPKAANVAPWSDGAAFTAPVGSFLPNRFGLHDMHGNVGEWCADWFDAGYYAHSPKLNPAGPKRAQAWRVVRGGSWYNNPLSLRCSGRHDGVPTTASTTNGFRVVMVP